MRRGGLPDFGSWILLIKGDFNATFSEMGLSAVYKEHNTEWFWYKVKFNARSPGYHDCDRNHPWQSWLPHGSHARPTGLMSLLLLQHWIVFDFMIKLITGGLRLQNWESHTSLKNQFKINDWALVDICVSSFTLSEYYEIINEPSPSSWSDQPIRSQYGQLLANKSGEQLQWPGPLLC